MINAGRTVFVSVACLIVSALIVLPGCGDSSSKDATASGEQLSADKTPASNESQDQARKVETRNYRQAEYELTTEWFQERSDERVGPYLKSAWHDPCCPRYQLVISSRPSRGFVSPLAAAELSRARAKKHLPKYREVSFKKVKIGHPAVRFVYSTDGEEYVEYFFAKCGTSISSKGSTNPGSYKLFSWFYENTASEIKPICAK